MSAWATKHLSDYPIEIIDGDRGNNYPSKEDFKEKEYCLFLNTGNVTKDGFDFENCNFISESNHNKLRKGQLKREDIILTTRGTVGNVAYFDKSVQFDTVRINSGMLILRVNSEKVSSMFFYQLMRSPLFQEQANLFKYGSAQPQLPISTLKFISLPLPPLPTQKKIAAVLGAYDDLIENNLQRIKLLEEMAQNTYQEWFVRLRFPNHQTTPINPQTGLPEGWEICEIGSKFKTASGGTPSRKKEVEFYENGTIPWIRTQELRNKLIVEPLVKITEAGIKNSSAKLFPKNTVLLAMYGNTIGETGFLKIEASTNQACCAFLTSELYSYYLYEYLKYNKKQILGYRMGAAQENISQEIIKAIPILIPTVSVLKVFSKMMTVNFDTIENLMRQNQLLKEARDILLPRLMSGIIDIDDYLAQAS